MISYGHHSTRKTLFDNQPGACEGRFDNNNLLPKISSKFKRNDRGFKMKTMSYRDDNSLVLPCNGEFKSTNEIGYYRPVIKGNVRFQNQVARKTIEDGKIIGKDPNTHPPNIYTYADNVNAALSKFRRNSRVPFNGCTMDKALGRDNMMYNLSDVNNLNKQEDNVFDAFMSANQLEAKKSSLAKPFPSIEGISPERFNVTSGNSLTNVGNLFGQKHKLSLATNKFDQKKYSMLLNKASQSSIMEKNHQKMP